MSVTRKPLDMRCFGTEWIAAEKGLMEYADALAERKHYFLVPKGNWRYVRKADKMELKAGMHVEWKKSNTKDLRRSALFNRY